MDLRLPGHTDPVVEKPVQLTVNRLDKEISSTNGGSLPEGEEPKEGETDMKTNGFEEKQEEKPSEETKTEAPVLGTVANGETEALAPVVTRSVTPIQPIVTQSGEDHVSL